MNKNEAISTAIGFVIIGAILFFFWEVITVFLLLGLAIFTIGGAILYLVSIVSEPGSDKDPTTYKRFFKALIIFSIPLSVGLYWEWSINAIPSTFSYLAFFVWGNTALATFAILMNKIFKKKTKKNR